MKVSAPLTSTSALLVTDAQGSILRHGLHGFCYTPYGSDFPERHRLSKLGYTALVRMSMGGYLPGSVRRYSPFLMRFTSPDSFSPFDEGGINVYCYCSNDPINNIDPTGHFKLLLTKASKIKNSQNRMKHYNNYLIVRLERGLATPKDKIKTKAARASNGPAVRFAIDHLKKHSERLKNLGAVPIDFDDTQKDIIRRRYADNTEKAEEILSISSPTFNSTDGTPSTSELNSKAIKSSIPGANSAPNTNQSTQGEHLRSHNN